MKFVTLLIRLTVPLNADREKIIDDVDEALNVYDEWGLGLEPSQVEVMLPEDEVSR